MYVDGETMHFDIKGMLFDSKAIDNTVKIFEHCCSGASDYYS